MTKHVSVVVPLFNEAGNAAPLAEQIDAVFQKLPELEWELLFVNDGSTDGTREELDALAARMPNLCPIHLVQNAGQSAALMAGIARAQGDCILMLDGDLQNDPADIPKLLDLLEQYDCVCGYRENRQDAWLRKLSSRVANGVRNAILHDGIRDSGCGLKGFRRDCARQLPVFNGVHRFFAVFVHAGGFSIAECPVTHHPRARGTSKYGVHNRLWRSIYDLIGVAWLRRRMVLIRTEGEG